MQAPTPQAIREFLERVQDLDPEQSGRPVATFERLGQRWRDLGLRPGDLVILALPNGSRLLNHFFGVLAAGGVPALIAPGTPSARLREMATLLKARAIGALR